MIDDFENTEEDYKLEESRYFAAQVAGFYRNVKGRERLELSATASAQTFLEDAIPLVAEGITAAEAHEALYRQLMQWRTAEAARLRMAPASVLADHLVMKICHTKPTESESLLALGARLHEAVRAPLEDHALGCLLADARDARQAHDVAAGECRWADPSCWRGCDLYVHAECLRDFLFSHSECEL